MANKGIVFNIQRFTIHDGPGVRTEVFLKGCPLRCRWCSNPESFKTYIEPCVYTNKCLGEKTCGECKEISENQSIEFDKGKIKKLTTDNENWEKCVEICPSQAIGAWGSYKTVDECMEEIRRDIGYYKRSGGGVTVSGGEALLQSDFVLELFQKCKNEDIHTCLESSFYANWTEIEKLLPVTDLFILDIKHMDAKVHKEYTGASNELILENLEKISKFNKEIILRIPVIPNINDDMENMKATADFVLKNMNGNVRTLQLLSYMRMGIEKYESIGMPYEMNSLKFNRNSFQKHVNEICEYFNNASINCLVGTKEKE